MKSVWLSIAFLAVTFLAGCANPLPKPTNANGTISPSVTVGDLDLTYQNLANYVTTYIASCHAAPTTPGCSTTLVANLKSASAKADRALHAAHDAVKNLPAGATGIDAAIADLQAALAFLEGFTNTIPKAFKVGAQSWNGEFVEYLLEAA